MILMIDIVVYKKILKNILFSVIIIKVMKWNGNVK